MVPLFRFAPRTGCVLNPATWIVTAAGPRSVGIGPDSKGSVRRPFHSLRAEFIRNVPTSLQKFNDLAFWS